MQNLSKYKPLKYLLAVFFFLLLVVIIVTPLWLASFVMTGERQTLDEAMKWQSERYDTSFYHGLDKTSYTVEGYDGYKLHAQLLINPNTTDQYVILSHGNTDNRIGSDRYPTITKLGLHGESLGAATTITALKGKPEVDFVVADCGFEDIEGVLKEGYRKAGIPSILVDIADIGARIRYHYAIKDMRPIDSLNDNHIPVLFIHGENDDLITPQNSILDSQFVYGIAVKFFWDGKIR